MGLTYTPKGELGAACPSFNLPSVQGKAYGLSDCQKPVLVVAFVCNHCPYTLAVEDRMIALAKAFHDQVNFLAICSNDARRYPEDSFEKMKERALVKNYPFPYLHDETQEVAKAFGAVCTPDFFVYGPDRKLAYRGRLDDSWQDPRQVKEESLKKAIMLLVSGNEPLSENQHPSMGCSIKWK